MLEKIRENSQGLAAKIILGLVILTFALAGIGSYTNSVDTSVAEVNGEKITQADFEKAYQNQRNRMAQQYGDMFETLSSDANYMANFRKSVVDSLINQTLVDQASANMSIRVSDDRIKKTILEMPEFQVEGVFDNNRYLALINQAGFYQSSDFRDYLRVEMTRRQLTQGLVASEFSLPYQEAQLTALQSQKRDIRFASISAKQFEQGIEISDKDINDYYLANQTRFENQEKVKVDYIAIDVNDIAQTINVSDEDISTYYQENMANYRKEVQRRISHILIEISDDESAAEAQIKSIQDKLANGDDFAQIAQELSADTFSGENGGDLDWFEAGIFGDEFDTAVVALNQVGEVSNVVKSDAGLHLIKLTDYQAEEIQALADIKDEVTEAVSKQKAQDRFFELQQTAAQLSFEIPDSLEDAASATGVEVSTSAWLSRFGNAAPFDNAKLIDAAFSDMIIQEQLNSDIIEVTDSLAVVLRLNEYQAAQVKPLAEVSEEIKTILIAQKASEKAQTIADELLTSFKAGSDISEQLTAHGASFIVKADVARFGSDVDASITREVFKLPHPAEGAISATTVNLSNGDLAIVEVQAVKAGESSSQANFAEQYTQQLAQSGYQSYVEALRDEAKITQRSVVDTTSQY
ncbi:SurA N-terminal domain-containing protein [Colwellia sp. 1_MG-2023]|uniref:SurA N-terminal domain-containing protein n=1 Tax=Colwellia sp. 1_MG-2023 TaxID=3062649 RepID=UPI0026E3CEE1|nr:SurA N-terminal domain-containing protein [Colwellia sp. 1_MG-2023]MDO6445696.1 SurA N-terminal domain-containing protein [Colwellia sp. 1_MG-2023]